MRIGLGSPTRKGITATQAKPRPGVGVKGATPEKLHKAAHTSPVAVPQGKDNAQNSSAPQANFGKTGKGDPAGSYGANANVHQGKYHK